MVAQVLVHGVKAESVASRRFEKLRIMIDEVTSEKKCRDIQHQTLIESPKLQWYL